MLKLVKLNEIYKEQFFDMMEEWTSTNEKIVPYAIIKIDYHYFDIYIKNLDNKKEGKNLVPSSVYFCLDDEINKFVGAVDIRHYLNDSLKEVGGHIGDGIRPSLRNRGYGTKMISLALEKCKNMGIQSVLMTCDKDNIASARTIIKNGGILENEIKYNGKIVQRYWIQL
jgi:predicted acetyltransferase